MTTSARSLPPLEIGLIFHEPSVARTFKRGFTATGPVGADNVVKCRLFNVSWMWIDDTSHHSTHRRRPTSAGRTGGDAEKCKRSLRSGASAPSAVRSRRPRSGDE